MSDIPELVHNGGYTAFMGSIAGFIIDILFFKSDWSGLGKYCFVLPLMGVICIIVSLKSDVDEINKEGTWFGIGFFLGTFFCNTIGF